MFVKNTINDKNNVLLIFRINLNPIKAKQPMITESISFPII